MRSMIRFLLFTTLFSGVALATIYRDEGVVIDDECMFDGCRRPIAGTKIASFNIDTRTPDKSLVILGDHNLKDLDFDQCRVRVHSQMLNPIQEIFGDKDRRLMKVPVSAGDNLDSSFTISRSRYSTGPKYRTWSFTFNTDTGAEITVNIKEMLLLRSEDGSHAYSGSATAVPSVEYKASKEQYSMFWIRAQNLILVQKCDSRF